VEEMLLLEYQKELGSGGIEFTVDNQCKADETASVDLAKLRRVFANLIGNSIKHNRNQDQLQIAVTIKNTEGRLTFCVADNGKGIHKEDMVHVFEPFYTSDSSRSVSGLGLSICKSIIEAHQGGIWAENNYLSGFKIFFTL
jgi:signal transduction histidine kinase